MRRGWRYSTSGIGWLAGWLVLAACVAPAAAQTAGVVYRCPGNPVLYTDALSAKEAIAKSCRTLEGAPITVIQGPLVKQRSSAGAGNAASGVFGAASRPGDSRIDPADQRARDGDARRILDSELRKEQDRLASMQQEFNNGEPERRGDERNYQKYIDRVADLKAGIARKEADIAAIKRELLKVGP